MSLVVISYPKINQADFAWIQSIRKEHDERNYTVVEPHFTFVFPVANIDVLELIDHVRQKAISAEPITFTLDQIRVVKDDFNEYWHTFLVPSNGYDKIIKLHDLLYTGLLEKELRRDIPYIPHVGIGSNVDESAMRKLTENLISEKIHIEGNVDELMVGNFDGGNVEVIETIQL